MSSDKFHSSILSNRFAKRLGISPKLTRVAVLLQNRFRYKYRLYKLFSPYVRLYFELLGLSVLLTALFSPDFSREILTVGMDIPLGIIEWGQQNFIFVLGLFTLSYLYHVRDKHNGRDLTDPPQPSKYIQRFGLNRVFHLTGWITFVTLILIFITPMLAVFLFMICSAILAWYVFPYKLVSDASVTGDGRFVWQWEFACQFSFIFGMYYFFNRIPQGEFDQAIGGDGSLLALLGLCFPLLSFLLFRAVVNRHTAFDLPSSQLA